MSNYFISLIINLLSICIAIFLIFDLVNTKNQINNFSSKSSQNYGKALYCNYSKAQFIWCIIFCIVFSINSIFLTIKNLLSLPIYFNIGSFCSLIGLSIVFFSKQKFFITDKGILPLSIFKGFSNYDFIPWNTTYSYELNTSTLNTSFVVYYIKNNKKEKTGSMISKKDLKILKPLISDLYPKDAN